MSDLSSVSASLPRLLRAGVWALALMGYPHPLTAAFWKPITPEELALVQPRVDPEAGVEVLFRETGIDDSLDDTTIYHSYVRLKVFTAAGVAALDKIEIVESRDAPVINVVARVVRPNGTIVEVRPDSIHARVIVRHGSERLRAKAFSPPSLEPGCLVEYQWEERSRDGIGGLQLYFQDRFPAWRVRHRIKPFKYEDRGYRVVTAGFRYEIPRLKTDAQGFYPFELTDVPALREEPWMPPDDMVQPWMVLYFLRDGQTPEEYWRDTGRAIANSTARLTRPTRELEERTRTLTAGVADELERLRRLAAFCRTEIADRSASLEVSALQPARLNPPRPTADDILRRREGTAEDLNLLFLALARAAGLEARVALVTDRSKRMFREPLPARFLLPDTVVAVRVGGAWRFFDPGNRVLPFGALRWENEGVVALIADRAKSEFVPTPRTPRAASGVTRRARLALAPDGTATGAVVVEYRGHAAVAQRLELGGQAAAAPVAFASGIEGGECTDFAVDGEADPDAPLVLSYRVRVPHFATATESRLVFPLAFFQRGREPVFTAATREHVIYLPYEFVEEDIVDVELPTGFVLEDAAEPASFALPPALEYRATLTLAPTIDRLRFHRVVSQGGMLFPTSTYRLMKQAFDDLHRQDAAVVGATKRVGGREVPRARFQVPR